MEYPLWATPERRAWLVELAQATFADYGIDLYTGQLVNPTIEEVIAAWKADDRAKRQQLWKLEVRRLHAAPQIRRRGPFDSIRREIYLSQRPSFEIVAVGIGAFTFKRMAKVVIPGLKRVVWVDLSGIRPEGVSKNKLRKLARYQRGSVPKELVPQVESRVQERIRAYLS
jgi:hypothetical protein